jgi:hypothetical protein
VYCYGIGYRRGSILYYTREKEEKIEILLNINMENFNQLASWS